MSHILTPAEQELWTAIYNDRKRSNLSRIARSINWDKTQASAYVRRLRRKGALKTHRANGKAPLVFVEMFLQLPLFDERGDATRHQ